MIDHENVRRRLEVAAEKSFDRPICKKDVELADHAARLYADLPPTHGTCSVVKILHGSAKTMKNRPEYGWAKANSYKLKELTAWDGVVDTVKLLLRENVDEREIAFVDAFDEMAGGELIENVLRRKFNSEKGDALANNAKHKKGFADAYKLLSPVFAKIIEAVPEERLARPKKVRPEVALSNMLTLDYVKDTLRELKLAQDRGQLRVGVFSGGPICGMTVVPELIDYNGKVKEFVYNLIKNSKKIDKHDTEYYQLVHVLTIRDDITPVSVRREYWLQKGDSNVIDLLYDIPFSENDLEKLVDERVYTKNPFKEKWLR